MVSDEDADRVVTLRTIAMLLTGMVIGLRMSQGETSADVVADVNKLTDDIRDGAQKLLNPPASMSPGDRAEQIVGLRNLTLRLLDTMSGLRRKRGEQDEEIQEERTKFTRAIQSASEALLGTLSQ